MIKQTIEVTVDKSWKPGALVKYMRAAAGLTQARVAERLGVSQARVSELEIGDGAGVFLLSRISQACGFTFKITVERKYEAL